MTRKDAVMRKIQSYGGWPFGVRRVEVDCECRVFFDGIFMRGFIDKPNKETSGFVYGDNIVIKESDYNKWKANPQFE